MPEEYPLFTPTSDDRLLGLLSHLLAIVPGIGILVVVWIGFILLAILGVVEVVLVIVATIKASENKIYRYPFNLRLIK